MSSKKRSHGRSNTNRSVRRTADTDPVFLELQAIIGHPAKLTPAVQKRISYDELVDVLDKSLGERLVTAWATEGSTSVYTPTFKDMTFHLSCLIRIMSEVAVCRQSGVKIIRLLLENHSKIIYRSLYTEQTTPVNDILELLIQFAKFHRGAYADEVYTAFDFSSLIYSKLLASLKIRNEEDEQRATSQHYTSDGSVRYHLISFLLVLLHYCSPSHKCELLGHRQILLSWMNNASIDSSEQLVETAKTLSGIAFSEDIPKRTKTVLFTEWLLTKLLSIFRVLKIRNSRQWTKFEADFGLFVQICTDPKCGVIFQDKGWYPPGTLDSHKSRKAFQSFNRVLVALSKVLNIADPDESLLLNAIFRACPETVALYTTSATLRVDPTKRLDFLRKFSFFAAVIALPLPSMLKDRTLNISVPPPVSVVIENIIPSPLNRSLFDLLLQANPISQYFTINLLAQSLQKLQSVSTLLASRGWEVAQKSLLEEAFHRLPEISSYSSVALKNLPPSSGFALSKLLRLYVTIFNDIVKSAKIDLSQLLVRFLEDEEQRPENGLSFGSDKGLELRNVLRVQSILPVQQKFWNKSDGLKLSYFTYMLKLATYIDDSRVSEDVTDSLHHISAHTYLFGKNFDVPVIVPFVQCLRSISRACSEQDLDLLWNVMDEAAARCLRSPFKYIDRIGSADLTEYEVENTKQWSPFLVALTEQWVYMSSSAERKNQVSDGLLYCLLRIFTQCAISGDGWCPVYYFISESKNLDSKYKSILRKLQKLARDPARGRRMDKDVWAALFAKFKIDSALNSYGDNVDFTRALMSAESLNAFQTAVDEMKRPINVLDIYSIRASFGNEMCSDDLDYLTAIMKKLEASSLSLNWMMAVMKQKNLWSPLLWSPTNSERQIVEFCSWFFRVVRRLVGPITSDSTDKLGFIYEYILNSFDLWRQDLKMATTLAESLKLLPEEVVSKLIVEATQDSKAIDPQVICALVESEDSLEMLSDEHGKVVQLLIRAALKSGDSSVVNVALKFANSPFFDVTDIDFPVVEEIFSQDRKGSYSLVCRLFENSATMRSCILQQHLEAISALDLEDMIPFADTITAFLVDCDDDSKLFVIKSSSSLSVDISDLLLQVSKTATQKRVELNLQLYLRSLVLLTSEDAITSLYNAIDSSIPQTVSINRLALAHSVLSSRQAPENLRSSAAQFIKSALQTITRYLSETAQLEESQKTIIRRIGITVERFSSILGLGKAVNAPIEAAIQRWFDDETIVLFVLNLMIGSSHQYLEYRKFFQMILAQHASEVGLGRESQLLNGIVCTLHHLYFLNPKEQSKASLTATKLIQYYSGTCKASDRLLLEVLHSLDASSNISTDLKIDTFSFSHEDAVFYVVAPGHCELSFSPKIFRSSLRLLSGTEKDSYNSEKLRSSNEYMEFASAKETEKVDSSHLMYDPLFVLPAVADMISRKLVDVNSLVSNHCLSYVIICLGIEGPIAAMARKILILVISLIDETNYKERDVLRTMLYSLHFAVADNALSPKPRFTIILTALAHLVPVLSNAGHYLFDYALQYVTKSPFIDLSDIPLQKTLLPSADVDDYAKVTNWFLNVLTTSLRRCKDLTVYEEAFVFEIAQTITSVSTTWESTKALSSSFLDNARSCSSS
ncbi:ribosome 60S biogenesis N-terminal-domain-containing protein [Myxozyma melibiosi]|uniref:Ribosome 60S biogenesis N-terminal-domain-containing protein n=1 Tax=Myxozyma melibiosi TaxID=54550 RepID=A0ABR1F604_9ASCO